MTTAGAQATTRPLLLILYGPKAAGKSHLARLISDRLGFFHFDPDKAVLELIAAGEKPDPVDGWLAPLSRQISDRLGKHFKVVTEATGAWDSDWRLAADFELAGVRVIKGLVTAPLETTLHRLRHRGSERAIASEAEAIEIYRRAQERAQRAAFDFCVDTDGDETDDLISDVVLSALDQ